MEVKLPKGKSETDLQKQLGAFPWKNNRTKESISLARTKTGSFFVRTVTLTHEEHTDLAAYLEKNMSGIQEMQFTTIGPTVGASLKRRAIYALIFASIAIILYLAIAFRKVPSSLSAWTFGISAVLALLHDLLITCGIFTLLSYETSFQFDTLFMTALLTIMGYSVMDTIVIFDRIRENLFMEGRKHPIAVIADQALVQTLTRTLSTGVVTLIMLLALFLFGSESIRWFMLALIIGTVIGTYSSFFVATPLVVFWHTKKKV